MQEINMPPFAPVLMESTRALGYSAEAAIADVLDNSISAEATRISLRFSPFDEAYFSVLDNGKGMNSEELNTAMRYGSVSPLVVREDNDLGRFGLGLKTASLSQCRRLTVISKKAGTVSARQWDLDVVCQKQDWILLSLDENEYRCFPHIEELENQESGTLVIWNVFDRFGAGEISLEKAMNEKMSDVRQHLALIFHRYLTGEKGINKVAMLLNEDPVIPQDPFLASVSTIYQDDEHLEIAGHNVTVRPFVLPHISKLSPQEISALGGKEGLRKYQGFYVYRNKRLLVWGTWFRLRRKDELSKLARIRVDIPNSLDDLWTLDIRKSRAIPPEIIRKNLARIVDKLAEGSKRTWTFRGKKETSESLIHMWQRFRTREGIEYTLNRDHPLIGSLSARLDPEGKKCLEQLHLAIEMHLPLNALYVDLANDEVFAVDEEKDKIKRVKDLAFVLLGNSQLNQLQRKELYEALKNTEQFCNYPEILDSVAKECLQ